jgi:hypothetical protein
LLSTFSSNRGNPLTLGENSVDAASPLGPSSRTYVVHWLLSEDPQGSVPVHVAVVLRYLYADSMTAGDGQMLDAE